MFLSGSIKSLAAGTTHCHSGSNNQLEDLESEEPDATSPPVILQSEGPNGFASGLDDNLVVGKVLRASLVVCDLDAAQEVTDDPQSDQTMTQCG